MNRRRAATTRPTDRVYGGACRCPCMALLEGCGQTVEGASGVTEALQKAETLGESMVALVTDVVMPGMSGTKLAHVLRRTHSEPPVVLMSGYAAGEKGQETLELATFLQKPFNLAALIKAL